MQGWCSDDTCGKCLRGSEPRHHRHSCPARWTPSTAPARPRCSGTLHPTKAPPSSPTSLQQGGVRLASGIPGSSQTLPLRTGGASREDPWQILLVPHLQCCQWTASPALPSSLSFSPSSEAKLRPNALSTFITKEGQLRYLLLAHESPNLLGVGNFGGTPWLGFLQGQTTPVESIYFQVYYTRWASYLFSVAHTIHCWPCKITCMFHCPTP